MIMKILEEKRNAQRPAHVRRPAAMGMHVIQVGGTLKTFTDPIPGCLQCSERRSRKRIFRSLLWGIVRNEYAQEYG